MNPQDDPVVYDKGKYHLETVEQYSLPETHAYHHTVYFLRWLIEHDLMSEWFKSEAELPDLEGLTNDTVLKIYAFWDHCLVDDMLAPEGNAFAEHYFDFERGRYLNDYIELLQEDLPSEFHIPLTEDNYRRLKKVIDRRFARWEGKAPASHNQSADAPGSSPEKRWWQFWRK